MFTYYSLEPVTMLCYMVKGILQIELRLQTILVYHPQSPGAHSTVGETNIKKLPKLVK